MKDAAQIVKNDIYKSRIDKAYRYAIKVLWSTGMISVEEYFYLQERKLDPKKILNAIEERNGTLRNLEEEVIRMYVEAGNLSLWTVVDIVGS